MALTAIPRMTIGLVSLAVILLLALDVLFGLFPSELETRRELRTRAANSLALQTAALLQVRDWRSVDLTLQAVRAGTPDIASIGLRRVDGILLAQTSAHPASWNVGETATRSGHDQRIALTSSGQLWGALEIRHHIEGPRHWAAWLWGGPTKAVLLFSLLATALYFLYLRRVLQHLDPSAAVPDRVRSAFDALMEGVLIVDVQGRVLLVNKAFEALRPASQTTALVGQNTDRLAWLVPAGDTPGADRAPWMEAMQQRRVRRGLEFQVREGDAVNAHVVLSCSPLLDERGCLRGCLVSVGDVTALERSHSQLLQVLADLATSKQQLEVKNGELAELANIDPLSGCLNRRSFFELGDTLLAQTHAQKRPLVCVMADIDHFKKVNDDWGHAVGDQAIRRFAELLRRHVRGSDLLGRYGGEEFCVVLAGADAERGRQLAETLRASVAANNGAGLDPGTALPISASFGVAVTTTGSETLAQLIDLADQAMYQAKQGGRNRVVVLGQPAALALA